MAWLGGCWLSQWNRGRGGRFPLRDDRSRGGDWKERTGERVRGDVLTPWQFEDSGLWCIAWDGCVDIGLIALEQAVLIEKGFQMVELGVNIDHVATVRQARRTVEPDPVAAAVLAELGGADSITVHLREDRRHIQDRDVRVLKETIRSKMNFELSCASEIVGIACEVQPQQATLVPEKREEVTTEGGLDLRPRSQVLRDAIARLKDCGVSVSLFIDPERDQVEIARELEVEAIELHTGQYALAIGSEQKRELDRLTHAGQMALDLGLHLHAGHGLTYYNVLPIASIPGMRELNIGHSIVSRAVLVGMKEAVVEMKRLMLSC